MGAPQPALRSGSRPLEETLACLEQRRQNNTSLSDALAVYRQIFSVQSRFFNLFEFSRTGFYTQTQGVPLFPGPLPELDPEIPRQALSEVSDAFLEAAPGHRQEIEAARASCEAEDVLLRRISRDHLNPGAQTLLLLALNPFYEKLACQVLPRLEEQVGASAVGELGLCPVCGEAPSMAKFDAANGARFVQCRLCRTQRMLSRLRCAFCGSEDGKKLGYLQAETDRAHRAEVCDSCGGYLKAVDERALAARTILHVEELLMTALDQEAIRRGYAPGRVRPKRGEVAA